MKAISKSEAYERLNDIQKEHQIDISPYIREMVGKDAIPYNVLVFINKYHPISQLETYNKIYERRRNNPLYKNLVNENLDIPDRAIALSSLLTQSLIRLKSLDESDKREYAELMNISMIAEAVCDYSIYGNTDRLNRTFMMVRDVFKNLFRKESYTNDQSV